MPIDLRSKNSSGEFKSTWYSKNIVIPSGSTGVLFSISPPAGKKLRLTYLNMGSDSDELTVVSDGNTVVTPSVLSFSVGQYAVGGNQLEFISASSNITVSTSVTTVSNGSYAYAYGD